MRRGSRNQERNNNKALNVLEKAAYFAKEALIIGANNRTQSEEAEGPDPEK